MIKSIKVKNFEIEIDVNINNHKKSNLAQGAMQVYLLRENPQRDAHEYAKGFNLNFNGFMLEIKENNARASGRDKKVTNNV